MIPRHFSRRTRFMLLLMSTLALGIGAFLWLMNDLERTSSSATGMHAAVQEETASKLASSQTTAEEPTVDSAKAFVIANGKSIPVELALDAAALERGLSYRPSLPDGEGMLFLFDRPQVQMFWMYEMRFPIDIIFINGTRVVRVASRVPTPTAGEYPAIISSVEGADAVLEINAGKAEEWGIGAGTEVRIERAVRS